VSLDAAGLTLGQRAAASVRFRVTAVASLFVLLVTACGGVLIVIMIARTVGHSIIDSAGLDAAAIDAQLSRGVSAAAAATTGRNDVVVQLVGPRGTVVAADRPSLLTNPLLGGPGVVESLRIDGIQDRFTVVAETASTTAERRGGIALIIVGRSTEQRDETRAEAAGVLSLAVPLLAVALALILWVSVGRALRPVEVMREEADTITAAHLRRRLAVPSGTDEIPRLAHTLNEMLDRIDDGQRRQRQFVSDASHELRSPLAVIRQTAEVAAAHPDRIPVAELAADVLAESIRLEGLVAALLLLARAESDVDHPTEIVDLDDVVLAEVARSRSLAPDAPPIDAHGVSAGRVRGTPLLFSHVVSNLLANARRHADHGVTVTLGEHVVRGRRTAVLVVEDDGAGVPEDQREAVFERFVRLDEARARDEGGAGLGLAIVRSIVEGAGGTIAIEDAAGGGARFVVRLPAVD
jgi:signal transduction histidine kinase